MPVRGANKNRRIDLAIVGTNPFAAELRNALVEIPFPFHEVRLLAAGPGEGALTEFNGEPRIILRAEPQALEGVQLAFFCEDPATAGAYRSWPEHGGYLAIDLTHGRDIAKEMPLADLGQETEPPRPRRGWVGGAHPLAHLIHTIVSPLASQLEIQGVRGVVLRPASDFGKVGLDELYQQSVNLFNFTDLPRQVFGRQLAFNLLPTDVVRATGVQGSIVAAHVRMLLGCPDLPVSLFLAVAPVFHAHTIALHLEFDDPASEADLRKVLSASGDFTVGPEPMTAVELQGGPRPHVGLIRRDPMGGGAWLWVLADRVEAAAAEGAVRLAARLLGIEPRSSKSAPA